MVGAAEAQSVLPKALVRFEDVYSEHAAFVMRTVRRLGVNAADVPDTSQQVFMTVHRRLSSFDGSSAVRTWLFGICRRVAADWRDRAHVRREVLSETSVEPVTMSAGQE